MPTTFNHEKNSFIEALGLDGQDLESINMKLAKASRYIIMESPKQSELCELIAKEFSYKELLFVATLFIVDKTTAMVNENPKIVSNMLFSKFLDKLRNGEEL